MCTVLIIDDDDIFRETLVSAMKLAGHVVATASDGFEGARFCRTSPPEVVLLDMIMPYGGLETIRVLKAKFPRLPIIAMTGSGRRRLDYALSLGADATLSKPFSVDQLGQALSRVLKPVPQGRVVNPVAAEPV